MRDTASWRSGVGDSKVEAGDPSLRSQFVFASSGGMIYAGTGEGSMQEPDIRLQTTVPSGGPLSDLVAERE